MIGSSYLAASMGFQTDSKDNFRIIMDILTTIQAAQEAMMDMLIEDRVQRGEDRKALIERISKQIGQNRKDLYDRLYANYGQVDLKDIMG